MRDMMNKMANLDRELNRLRKRDRILREAKAKVERETFDSLGRAAELRMIAKHREESNK